ncbi:hypothetical protein BDU57DRAFT_301561 [Ampelomyces quisqualis]|uniref:N-acetyltransferase domain-containing protein n=1 Tax=Ampelomyces quisqualis TaxID=50730 RepID=A0A6A5QKU3_AMPQU|nr:hypothetical protein BDU57DRAFT_301561 [Ampelomyces quisqualis]
MGRSAAYFCSRESAYRIQTITAVPEQDMTWQQEETFGPVAPRRKHRGTKWRPLDLSALPDPPVCPPILPGEGGDSAGPNKDPMVRVDPQARAKAIACDITSTAPVKINLKTPNHSHKTHKPRKLQDHSKKHLNNPHGINMGALPKSAFVPPHMRKSTTTGTASAFVPPHMRKTITTGTASASAGASGSAINGTPPSPPTTLEPKVDATGSHQVTTWGGPSAWAEPKPEAPAAPRRENPRWPRTRGPPKKTVWPKQREMRPVPTASSQSDGGVSCKSNSHGDSCYDVKKLTDWNGKWLPPPEEWSARKGHTNRHFGQDIERWMNGHPEECRRKMDTTSPSFCKDGTCKELVPKNWIVSNIEQGSLNQFWKLMPSREPAALSDISDRPPFWERYEETKGTGAFIEALTVPDALVDPTDLANHFQGADVMASAEVRLESIMRHRRNSHKRLLAKQRRPIKEVVPTAPQLPDRRLIPKSNVYFRPVHPADVEGISAIYNYYVEETIYANEFDARTCQHILDRIDVVIKAGLPFLVAVSRDSIKKDEQGFIKQKVVGFASLDDYCDQSSMYRYTFELELYVHPGYLRQNIASCLLDRLLEMANTSYNARGGYEYINDGEYLKTGPSRVIKTIMLTVLKENGDTEENDEYKFLKKFKFIRTGHIPTIGYKLGKVVDAVLYRHTTSELIHPHVRP